MNPPILDQINLVVSDMQRSIAFYRALGLDIQDGDIWTTETGAHHVVMRMPGGLELALDSDALARVYNRGWREAGGQGKGDKGGRVVISFRLADAAAVDETCAQLQELGSATSQPPYDTFWGSRYAIVEDPDGNHIGLMSPPDPARRKPPPKI